MFKGQLEKIIEEQKECCPILTSEREYPQGNLKNSLLKELDTHNILMYEFLQHEKILDKKVDEEGFAGIDLVLIGLGGFLVTAAVAESYVAFMGGIAAGVSAAALYIFQPKISARYQSRKRINLLKETKLEESKSINRPSYGTRL